MGRHQERSYRCPSGSTVKQHIKGVVRGKATEELRTALSQLAHRHLRFNPQLRSFPFKKVPYELSSFLFKAFIDSLFGEFLWLRNVVQNAYCPHCGPPSQHTTAHVLLDCTAAADKRTEFESWLQADYNLSLPTAPAANFFFPPSQIKESDELELYFWHVKSVLQAGLRQQPNAGCAISPVANASPNPENFTEESSGSSEATDVASDDMWGGDWMV
jgi:hypothetical protein